MSLNICINKGALEDFEEEEKGKQSAPPPVATAPNPGSSFPVFTPPDEDSGDEILSQEFMEGMTKLLDELTKGKEEGGATDFSRVVEDLEKNLEQSPEFSGVMESLVGHLVSKEVLYDPMVEMRSKVSDTKLSYCDNIVKLSFNQVSSLFRREQGQIAGRRLHSIQQTI